MSLLWTCFINKMGTTTVVKQINERKKKKLSGGKNKSEGGKKGNSKSELGR